jgi:hypothetical protein
MQNESLIASYICSNGCSKFSPAIKKKTYSIRFAGKTCYLVCGNMVCKKCFRIKCPVKYERPVTIRSNHGHTGDMHNDNKCCVVCKTNIIYYIAVSGLWRELRSWRRKSKCHIGSPNWQDRIRYTHEYGYRSIEIQEIKSNFSLGL